MKLLIERVLLPLVIPLGAILFSVVVIVAIGIVLLAIGVHTRWDFGLFDMSAPVVVAMLLATGVLVGAIVLARVGSGTDGGNH